MSEIRNFAIIAHVDHGKSTLADRFLELTGVIEKDKHNEQMLDRNPISRERGITIKLAPVRMEYTFNGVTYNLNLIDTPGHVDFSYEVERTLACVEGVILLVDATQGIQAQTIAHTYKALEQNLIIIPAINKIDMPQARPEETKKAITHFLGIQEEEIHEISAKTGVGVKDLLEEVIKKIPSPENSISERKTSTDENVATQEEPRALIFDSYFDPYRGVIAFIRVFNGTIKRNMNMSLTATHTNFVVNEVGIFNPDLFKTDELIAGEIGYMVTNLKDIHAVHVGDTIIRKGSALTQIEGYREVLPMVYSSMFPTDPGDYENLTVALEKLTLNDASVTYEPISSKALGSGYRVGFLGLLHADVIRQRLEQEYDLEIVLTAPNVEYREIHQTDSTKDRMYYEEPIVHITIVTPQEYSGAIMQLCEESRGTFSHMDNSGSVVLEYDLPLSELISHFFDSLKTVSSGYASLQWELKEYKPVDVDRLEVLLNLEPVEEFSEFVVASRAYRRGREIADKLKELIPRQQFEVKIQTKYKNKIIASSRIAPFRKDVIAGLYGGDRTRKDKLLKKQKKGKKKMKQIGNVDIPKDVFMKLFSREK